MIDIICITCILTQEIASTTPGGYIVGPHFDRRRELGEAYVNRLWYARFMCHLMVFSDWELVFCPGGNRLIGYKTWCIVWAMFGEMTESISSIFFT